MTDAKNQKARTQAWRSRMRERGLVKLELWVRPEHRDPLRWVARQLLDGASLDPVANSLTPAPGQERIMPEIWTTQSLKQALSKADDGGPMPGEMTVEMVEGVTPALKAVMHLYGDLDIFVSVEGEQILCSVLLWPVAEQEDPDAFNRMILGLNKAMPLSAFGLTKLGEDPWYELFGALSSRSLLSAVVTELRTLASNAIDVVEDLHPDNAAAAA